MKLALGKLGAFGDLALDSTGAVLLHCERIPVPLGNPKSISALASGRLVKHRNDLAARRVNEALASGDPVGSQPAGRGRLVAPALEQDAGRQDDTENGGHRYQVRRPAGRGGNPRHTTTKKS